MLNTGNLRLERIYEEECLWKSLVFFDFSTFKKDTHYSSHVSNASFSIECCFLNLFNPFLVNVPILYPPENTRKPLVFWCFQGVWNGNIGQKWLRSIFSLCRNQVVDLKDKLTHFSPLFHIETSHLIWIANEVTGFYWEYNTWLKWLNGPTPIWRGYTPLKGWLKFK